MAVTEKRGDGGRGTGRTDLANIVGVCSRCHELVHESGWTGSGSANGKLTFSRPDGRVLATGPPGSRPDVRDDLGRAIGRTTAA